MGIRNKLITFHVSSKGRKYFKVNYVGRTHTYNLTIDTITKGLEVGQTYHLAVKEIVEQGYKTTYRYEAYAVFDHDFTLEDSKTFAAIGDNLDYIEEKIHQYWYQNGASKVEQGIKRMEALGIDCSNFKERYQALNNQWSVNEEKLNIQKSKDRIHRYFDYIKEAIEKGYWYHKGENVVLNEIEFLTSKGMIVEKYEKKLNELKKEFETFDKKTDHTPHSIPNQSDLFHLQYPNATHFICWECGCKAPIRYMQEDGTCGC